MAIFLFALPKEKRAKRSVGIKKLPIAANGKQLKIFFAKLRLVIFMELENLICQQPTNAPPLEAAGAFFGVDLDLTVIP